MSNLRCPSLPFIPPLWLAAILGFAAGIRGEETRYELQVQGILTAKCGRCHGSQRAERKADLDLTSYAQLLRGGESGALLSRDEPTQSLLWLRIESGEMPPDPEPPLSSTEKRQILAWLRAGAAGTVEPTDATWEKEQSFWAFRPTERPQPPVGQRHTSDGLMPLDVWVQADLDAHELTFAPETRRDVWARRVYWDLTGLPPSPTELDAYLRDRSADADSQLVDRLLASPQFGERWGRLWLDVVGYSDSNGYIRHDSLRPWSFRYRDYVIRSLNADLPYDQFWVEQLAGDELVNYPATEKPLSEEQRWRLIATHFLRNAPDGTDHTEGNEETRTIERYAVLESQLQITISAMFGLTIDCARCHSHKFDPIPQRDYYALQAIFYPAFNVKSWVQPKDRWIHSVSVGESQAWTAANAPIDEAMAKLKTDFDTWRQAHMDAAYDVERTAREKQLAAQLAAWEAQRPPEPERIAWVTDLADAPPSVPLLKRGDYFQPGADIAPGALSVLEEAGNRWQLASPPSGAATTGRRLAFARWATRPNSRAAALMARVQVDRIWRGHFGVGLIPTPENWGASGLPPTNPELLEWLATEFIRGGWRQKNIHRQIVLSRTYRQAGSVADVGILARDPENQYLSRFPIHRLSAEQIRDGMLHLAGELNLTMYGAPVEYRDNGTRKIIIPTPEEHGSYDVNRRSIYLRARRSEPISFLQAFDMPAVDPNCLSRPESTVVSQSLAMLNSEFSVRIGRKLAERVARESELVQSDPIAYAFLLVYSRQPEREELERCKAFVAQQAEAWREAGELADTAPLSALADLCRMLLASNEFLSPP